MAREGNLRVSWARVKLARKVKARVSWVTAASRGRRLGSGGEAGFSRSSEGPLEEEGGGGG